MRNNMIKELETQRLILRKPVIEDLKDFHKYASKSNIGPNAGWLPHYSLEESKHVLKSFIKENNVWAITLKAYNKLIGTIDLRDHDYFSHEVYEIGYSLDDKYWNKGIVTEALNKVIDYAFGELKIKRLIASHSENNIASQKVLEKNGFIYTHTEETTLYLSVGIKTVKWYEKLNIQEENNGNKIKD